MTYVKTLFKLFQVYFLLNGYMWLTCGNFVFSSWSRVWVGTFCRFQKCQFLLKCFKQKSILSKCLAQESLIQLIILIHLTIGLKLSLLFRSPLAWLSALEYTPKNFFLLNFKRHLIQSQTPETPPSHFAAGNGTGFIDWEHLLSFSFLSNFKYTA